MDQSLQDPAICKVSPMSVCNPLYGTSVGRGAFNFTPGFWNTVEQIVTLNTVTNNSYVADGRIAIKFNGKIVIEFNKIVWRSMDSVKFQGLQWDTFFGGSDNSWITPVTQLSYFRDLQLSILN